MRLKDKVAIVTGAAHGMGEEDAAFRNGGGAGRRRWSRETVFGPASLEWDVHQRL
jgi:hypothetical protein